jgi:hypothetical protein
LKAWTNLYETWHVYHDTWANLNGMLINPFHQSVCLYVYPPIVAKQRLCKDVTAATNAQAIKELFDASFSMRSMSHPRKVGY